jgi:hypothetical protein
MVKKIEERDKRLSVYHSISVAKLAGSMSMSKSPIKIADFLPFDLEQSESRTLESKTVDIIKTLVRKDLIPDHILSAFGPYLKGVSLLD